MYKIRNKKTGLYQVKGSDWKYLSDWNGGGKVWGGAGPCKNHLAHLASDSGAYPNWRGEYTPGQLQAKEELLKASEDWEIVYVNFDSGEKTTWPILEFYPKWLDR